MNPGTISRVTEKLMESSILRAATLPDLNEIDIASQEIGLPFAPDYCEFLLKFGAAMIGPYPIYGLRPVEAMGDDEWSVVVVTKRHRAHKAPATDRWTVISSDHSGNPVGMDRNGKIWIHDHDFGGVAQLASSFEEYIRVKCLGLMPNF